MGKRKKKPVSRGSSPPNNNLQRTEKSDATTDTKHISLGNVLKCLNIIIVSIAAIITVVIAIFNYIDNRKMVELVEDYYVIENYSYNASQKDEEFLSFCEQTSFYFESNRLTSFLKENPGITINLGVLVLKNEGERSARDITISFEEVHSLYNQKYLAAESPIQMEDLPNLIIDENAETFDSNFTVGRLAPGESINIPVFLALQMEQKRVFVEYKPLNITYVNERTGKEYTEVPRNEGTYAFTMVLGLDGGKGGVTDLDGDDVLDLLVETFSNAKIDELNNKYLSSYGAYLGYRITWENAYIDFFDVRNENVIKSIVDQGYWVLQDGTQEDLLRIGNVFLTNYSNHPDAEKIIQFVHDNQTEA